MNDLFSITRWQDYSRAKDAMFEKTDIPEAPRWTVESDGKRAARPTVINQLLRAAPYEHVDPEKVTIPDRPKADDHEYAPDHGATL